jgi:hypothetical protein
VGNLSRSDELSPSEIEYKKSLTALSDIALSAMQSVAEFTPKPHPVTVSLQTELPLF